MMAAHLCRVRIGLRSLRKIKRVSFVVLDLVTEVGGIRIDDNQVYGTLSQNSLKIVKTLSIKVFTATIPFSTSVRPR